MSKRLFVGFGFGPIQSGLFLLEAYQSHNFNRLVVAEVVPELVAAIRRADGRYRVNVATRTGVDVHEVTGVEMLDPNDPGDRDQLLEALTEATEIATALPSVEFYTRGNPTVASLLARAIQRKQERDGTPPCVVYAAENHNHAAEILDSGISAALGPARCPDRAGFFQTLNTVIGKMSKVVTDPAEISQQRLAPVVDDSPRAFLVEEFNRILISRIHLPGFRRGIRVFEEKPDLLPFEEAKLYGHNATHALIGYLADRRGYRFMSEAGQDQELMALARSAFLEESGAALIARRGGMDPLFTAEGYRAYAEDLLARMVNPYLRDAVDRVIRDPRRKLGWEDRLVGTMRLALDAGVTPRRFAQAAAAALELLAGEGPGPSRAQLLDDLWTEPDQPPGRKTTLRGLILNQ